MATTTFVPMPGSPAVAAPPSSHSVLPPNLQVQERRKCRGRDDLGGKSDKTHKVRTLSPVSPGRDQCCRLWRRCGRRLEVHWHLHYQGQTPSVLFTNIYWEFQLLTAGNGISATFHSGGGDCVEETGWRYGILSAYLIVPT